MKTNTAITLLTILFVSARCADIFAAAAGAFAAKTNDTKENNMAANSEIIDPTMFQQEEAFFIAEINQSDDKEKPAEPDEHEKKPYIIPEKSEIMEELSASPLPIVFNPMCYKRGFTLALEDINKDFGLIKYSCKGFPKTDLPGPGNYCGAFYGDTYCYRRLPMLCINKLGINRPAYNFTGSASSNGWTEGIVRETPPVPGCAFKYLKDANNYCRKLFGCGYRVADYHDGRYMPGMNGTTYANFTWNSSSTYKGYYAFWTFVVHHNNKQNRYWATHNDVWGANPHCWK